MIPSWKEIIFKKYNCISEHLNIVEHVVFKDIFYLCK